VETDTNSTHTREVASVNKVQQNRGVDKRIQGCRMSSSSHKSKPMSASRVCSSIISFKVKITERLRPGVSHHYNLHEKVQIAGVSPNGIYVYKLPIKVLFGEDPL
jgi:hypothetical protein